jgi:hypothetical protein
VSAPCAEATDATTITDAITSPMPIKILFRM